MRLPVDRIPSLTAAIALCIALGACNGGSASTGSLASLPRTGPAADYPVVIGEPFTIGDTTYRPDDQLNYDAVGMVDVDDAADALGISGAHKTLPLPSYVEVTSLDTGRTILVRLERRGPMRNDTLIGLSPAALAQLGAAAKTGVRVRRVNPPEVERSALRKDGEVPVRMDTPEPLLKVLRRKLAEQSPIGPPVATPPEMPNLDVAAATDSSPVPEQTALVPSVTPTPTPTPAITANTPAPSTIEKVEPDLAAAPAEKPDVAISPPAAKAHAPSTDEKSGLRDNVIVQVGAFSNEAGARKLAKKLDGNVSHPGKYWLVRLGPFASRGEAGPALEKARAAGYRDARIQRID